MKRFFKFVKIEHSLFTLPLSYSGLLLGVRVQPSASLLGLVLLSSVGARTAAFALNRIIDRDLDKRNPRTSDRELPRGRISLPEAVAVLGGGCVMYCASASLISLQCLLLSPIPLIIFVAYPFMKRFTFLAHFGVGLGMSMAPLGGFIAGSPGLDNPLPATLLALFTIFWGVGFDIIYATLDEEFDREENLHSFVSRFGRKRALAWSSVFHSIAFLILSWLSFIWIRTWYAAPFALICGILLCLERWKKAIIEPYFFRINASLGVIVFAMIVTGLLLR